MGRYAASYSMLGGGCARQRRPRMANGFALLAAYVSPIGSATRAGIIRSLGCLFGAMPIATAHLELTIRPMGRADAAAVAEMARELAAVLDDPDPALDPSDLVRDGMGPERWFDCLVAEFDGRLIGYAIVCRGYEAHMAKRRLWLSDLYVRADARRTGTGRGLMAQVARLAIAQGCEAVYWDLWRLNGAGKAFYEGLGAVEIGDLAIWHAGSLQLAAAGD